MSNLLQKQIQAILNLPAPEKYSHFIKETVGSDQIWMLYKSEEYDGDLEDSPIGGEYAYLQDDNSNLFYRFGLQKNMPTYVELMVGKVFNQPGWALSNL
ncbi:hypothetical protein [Acinetobacter tianfuensis]|uniref:Uncharacterized protein n=1 Tax=Acinetobacter tianfuensis TaxID=2419603 RepID=A0A3A8ERM9_9GAMM|nr:hypothetical protein [Acinetobacter tianfuensis]RKG32624.1 hypothetical protein D7V32_05375 [Acinetobacter tianfuensis]